MVDSTNVAGGCRCACSSGDPYGSEGGGAGADRCCNPQVFTSVLLGILACVLMTGGVFLAFHRWDPLWLIVSGIGIVLILIGSILHCCTSGVRHASRRQFSSGKGCCGRTGPDHMNGHLVANNGSLTEQLLPLSNARSVSQLSLNMLPGYFPPVVTTYGIEQHSAVVQNINRIIQQQQNSTANCQTASNGSAGKSFILLSLPGETTPSNIQNLVATMYQLDDTNTTNEPPTSEIVIPSTPAPAEAPTSTTLAAVTFKSVEVQTCTVWPHVASNTIIPSTEEPSSSRTTNCNTECIESRATVESQVPVTSNSERLQSETSVSQTRNLMDCSTNSMPICDILNTDEQISSSVLTNNSSTDVLIDVTVPPDTFEITSAADTSNIGVIESVNPPDVIVTIAEDPASSSSDVLIDISENTSEQIPEEIVILDDYLNNSLLECNPDVHSSGNSSNEQLDNQLTVETSEMQSNASFAVSNESSLSVIEDGDGDSVGRSSPPPSYEDVALHSEAPTSTAHILPYGTI